MGEYEGSVKAIKRLLEDVKDPEKFPDTPEIRVGLHLNLHAGFPVSDPSDIKPLLRNRKKNQVLVPVIQKDNKGNVTTKKVRKKVLRPIAKFKTSIRPKFVRKEVEAQYDKFETALGFDPDHLSAHFPMIFMTPKYFEVVCDIAKEKRVGKPAVPIRNPFLIWQIKNEWMSEKDRIKQKSDKKTWKIWSKTKNINFKTAITMLNTVIGTLLAGWREKNLMKLTGENLHFPDYTNCNLYGNGASIYPPVERMLEGLPDYRPEKYKKGGKFTFSLRNSRPRWQR